MTVPKKLWMRRERKTYPGFWWFIRENRAPSPHKGRIASEMEDLKRVNMDSFQNIVGREKANCAAIHPE